MTVWLSRSPSLTPSALAAGWPVLRSGTPVQDAAAPLLPCVVTSTTGTTIGARLPPGMGAGWFVVVVSLRVLPSHDPAHECSTVTDEVVVRDARTRVAPVYLCALSAPHRLSQVSHEVVVNASTNSTASSSLPAPSDTLWLLSRSSTSTIQLSYDPPAVLAVTIAGRVAAVPAVGGVPIIIAGTSFSLVPEVRDSHT